MITKYPISCRFIMQARRQMHFKPYSNPPGESICTQRPSLDLLQIIVQDQIIKAAVQTQKDAATLTV